MAWIKTIPPEEADGSLSEAIAAQAAFYPPEYEGTAPGFDAEMPGIVASHSLIPEALRHAFSTFGALISPDLPLDRRQHEMIATAVSTANGCRYCGETHADFLRRHVLDEGLVRAIREDFATAPISERDRAMLGYAVRLTEDATRISPADHERLRSAGFDDRAILQITLIAAWFNYINRVADALGIGRD